MADPVASPIVDVLKSYLNPAPAGPAPAGANADDWTQANALGNVKYAPQAQSLYDQFNTINQTLDHDVNAQQQYGQIADQRMAGISAQLHGQLQQGVEATKGIYAAGQSKVGGLYDELLSSIGKAGDEVKGMLGTSAAALGQEQSLTGSMNPMDRIRGRIAEMSARASTNKASSVSNLVTLGAQMQALSEQKVGSSDQNYAQKRADLATGVHDAITKLQTQAMTNSSKVMSQFTNLARTKAADIQGTLMQLTNSRTKAEAQAAKDQLTMQLREESILQRAQAAVAKNDPNSLDNQLKQGRLDAMNAKANAPEPDRFIGDSEGTQNLEEFLNNLRYSDKGAQSHITGSQFAGIKNFINNNLSAAHVAGTYNTADPATILGTMAQQYVKKDGTVDLSKFKSKGSTRSGSDYQVDMPTLLNAIEARFRHVGTAKQIGKKI